VEDLSEKEQLDQMRFWWSKYGSYVLAGIVMGASLLFGINYYQNETLQSQLDASTSYEKLIKQVSDNKLEEAQLTTIEIETLHESTIYVAQAHLTMARFYMDQNRDEDAANSLRSIIKGNTNEQIKDIARIRLARIYLHQEKPEEVISLLSNHDRNSFSAVYDEALGDAYTMQGKISDAKNLYLKVLMNPLSQDTVDSDFVRWKELDLSYPDSRAEETNKTTTEIKDNDNNAEFEDSK